MLIIPFLAGGVILMLLEFLRFAMEKKEAQPTK
jgi:hypothetical protein